MPLDRKDKLVKNAMEDLRNGSAILTHDWLDENKCSSDEALYVAESVAHSINRSYFNDAYPRN
ncbi:hypothetical protein ACNO5E_19540 [Vibrio parahaemolyticus]|uniref:hypothetical protein n=1 Tax=Vibrio parahaemolyticus TaxID=670 RepID=UPI00081381A2|nr:hypothetical protein [Vibrio parahaemolyticus]OCP68410.1 hypothetical protein AKH08_16495 [Vibrio parahaemolyticus]